MPFLTSLLVLLVVSRLLGQLMSRLGQPAIVGEILAGVVLGPAALHLVAPTEHLAGLAELSVFLIVLSAGLEMDFADVAKAMLGRGTVIAALAFAIPMVAGTLLGFAFALGATKALFLGLCMAITALPVALRILENFNLLDSQLSRYVVATAVLNDVAALLLLGVLLDGPAGGTLATVVASLLITSVKFSLFAAFVFLASRGLRRVGEQSGVLDAFLNRVTTYFGREALFGMAVLFVLLFGSVSENLGAHFVIGAFFGGLLLSRDLLGSARFAELQNVLRSLTEGFLAPIFFAFLGLHFTTDTLKSPLFVASVLAVAMASKIYAGILGGKILGLPKLQRLGIGIILNGRGIMELVVANIALQRGLIGPDLFSALVLMGVVTTLVTPVMFRRLVLAKGAVT